MLSIVAGVGDREILVWMSARDGHAWSETIR